MTFSETGTYKFKAILAGQTRDLDRFKSFFENLRVKVNGEVVQIQFDENKLIATVEKKYSLEVQPTVAPDEENQVVK